MQNTVNEQSIRKFIKSKTFSYEMILSGMAIIGTVVIISLVSPENRELYTAWWAFPLFAMLVLTHFIGRYTNFLRKKACVDWYKWDKGRIDFFRNKQLEIRNNYEEYLNKAILSAIQKNPENVKESKKVVLEMLESIKKGLAAQRDLTLKELNESDMEIVRLLQLKARIDDAEEHIEEVVVDFFTDIYREEQNPELLRMRLETNLRKEMQWWLDERLAWYEGLIDSCQKSTAALAVILRNDYGLALS